MERWKQIDGFGSRYEISTSGKVKNRETGKILKPIYQHGYPIVRLRYQNISYPRLVHRLVAQCFIPNPNNYPIVNHKDENPANCNADNLEWCTCKYNHNYGTSHECHKVPVKQLSLDGELICVFGSLSEASEKTGIRLTGISDTINKRHKSAGGYKWEYVDRDSGWKKSGTYSKEILGIQSIYMLR